MTVSGPIRSCGFVVFRWKGEEVRFLLLKSARDGYWGLPKGHILPGESPLDSAFRELREETGHDDVSVLREFHAVIDYRVLKGGEQRPKRVDYFLGEKKGPGVRLSREHLDYRWATLDEAEELLVFENLKDVLRKAHEAVSSHQRPGGKGKRIGPWGAVLLLALIIILGVVVRTQNFHRLGYTNRDAFPVESAQRYHYIRMVARGKGIPRVDRVIQHPEGFNTRTDTIAQEYLVGYAYRLFSFTGLPLETFLRYLLRLLWVLTVIPVYLIALHATGSRGAALLSALFFALALPSLRRSLGNEIYREHIAFLPLGLHLYYLLRALSCGEEEKRTGGEWRSSGRQQAFYRWAVLSGSFLLLCLVAWKVNRFYYLTLMVFFLFLMLSQGQRARAVKLLAIFTLINVAASVLLETPLKYDRSPFSMGMILTYALLGAGLAQLFLCRTIGLETMPLSDKNNGACPSVLHRKLKRALIPVAVFAAVAAVFWTLRPEMGYYSHVWQTIFARLRYLSKPDLPSLLPFEARHYWVPPYTSPTLFMLLNDFLFPLLASCVAAGIYMRRLFKREGTPSEGLLLYMLVAFLGFYLVFHKLMTFLIFFASIFLALSLNRAGALPRGRRNLAVALVVAAVGVGAYQSMAGDDSYLARGLKSAGLKPLYIPQAVPDGATEELIEWFAENTGKDEATLAEFPVSVALLAYSQRPIVLHAMFEGENRFRFREFTSALFGDEVRLYMMMKKYRAQYFVYSAHFLLRTDSNMSYRYTADAIQSDRGWTAYSMHFHPERLRRFALVYQNSAYRVFRLVEEGERVPFRAQVYAPVFDESLLAGLHFSIPRGVTREEAFLYTIVSAYSDLRAGKRLMEKGEGDAGLKLLRRSVETFPFIPGTHTALAAYYRSRGNSEKTEAHVKKARALNAGQWQEVLK